jgi:chromosome segregation ATPase
MDTPSALLPDNDKLFYSLRNISQKMQELFEKYGLLQKRNESLKDELKVLKGEMNYCTSKVKNIETEKEEIAKEYLKFKEENDYKHQLIKDYEFKLKDLEEQNLKLRSDYNNKSDEFEVIKNKYDSETKNLSNLIFEKEEIIKERVLLAERLKEEIAREKDRNETKTAELLLLIEEKENFINQLNNKKSEEESFSEQNEILRTNVKLNINQVIEKINSLVS